MKLADAMKETGAPFVVDQCSRETLPAWLKETGRTRGVEVGVYKGEFSEHFAKQGLEHYAVDPWMAFPGQGRTQQRQERQDFIYGHAGRLLAPYPNCKLIRATSMDALAQFEDESLDYVYIDGDHEYSHIIEDITEWTKKVKKGGIIAGHDYFDTSPGRLNVVCHGKRAVDDYTTANGITNWYIYGKIEPVDDQKKDDRYYSWLWIKA